jgi:hypothetical protein
MLELHTGSSALDLSASTPRIAEALGNLYRHGGATPTPHIAATGAPGEAGPDAAPVGH